MISSLRQTSYPFSRPSRSPSSPSWFWLSGNVDESFPFCQVLINGVPFVFFVEVIQPTIDCITDEIVFIQRFRFPIVSQMTSIRIGHVASRDCEKSVFSCPGSAWFGVTRPSHLQDSDLGLWCHKISTLSGTTHNLIVRFCASSFCLQNVGLDTKKDPHLTVKVSAPLVKV